jgi:parvulin-like peptidyl-prolyl isomerase
MIPPLRDPSSRPFLLLVLGAASGVALAAMGLLGGMSPGRASATWASPTQSLPPNAVARVNGEVIRAEDYQRALEAVREDRRDGLDDTKRGQVLDRLIEEELLVQRGLALGFARQDTRVRKDLTAAVIDSVVAEYQDVQPTDAELQTFYDAHRDFFTGPGRLRVRQVWCRTGTTAEATVALDRAQQAASRLRAGEQFATVRDALGDRELAPLPDALLPAAKLADYLGPTALRTTMSLAAGAVSEPIRSSTGYHVLQVLERQPDAVPPLDAIKTQVAMEFRRRRADQALRAYVDDLRASAQVEIATPLP